MFGINFVHNSSLLISCLWISHVWICNLHFLFRLIHRQQSNEKQVVKEKAESCSTVDAMTKHVDLSEDNVDKACLSVSRLISVPGDGIVQLDVDRVNLQPIGDSEWSDVHQTTDARIADVREISPEAEASSMDIPVVSPAVDNHNNGGSSPQPWNGSQMALKAHFRSKGQSQANHLIYVV